MHQAPTTISKPHVTPGGSSATRKTIPAMTETCDFLIIGGGSAGCIIAKRLAEKSAGRIILLEAGKKDEGDAAAVDLFRLDDQTDDYDWGFKAATLAGAKPELNYARAKILAAAPTTMIAPFCARPIQILWNGKALAPKAGARLTWPPISIA